MITLQEAWDIIERLNDDAHSYAYESWVYADELDEESGDAEDQRVLASEEQQGYFREFYNDLPVSTRQAILAYRLSDEDFKDQFDTYHGVTH